ncbi:hypothetical protein PV328_001041 [Microctonus aethiopoides]|uniref:Uncharacterized protein n=1 Tax=Microctonus aethiopoides TaxID=144406 RepID=A0AA39FWD0_9HYME|nr:hypothetical protein PV328_001041 [Microctonus aethiopoides]
MFNVVSRDDVVFELVTAAGGVGRSISEDDVDLTFNYSMKVEYDDFRQVEDDLFHVCVCENGVKVCTKGDGIRAIGDSVLRAGVGICCE